MTDQNRSGWGTLAERLLDQIPDVAVAVDEASRIVSLNARAETFFGRARHTLIGEPLGKLVVMPSGPGGAAQEATAKRSDGSQLVVTATRSLLDADRGLSLVRILAPAASSTRGEAMAWYSHERLRLLTDSLPAFISYVDADQRFRFANKSYEQWGWTKETILGRTLREVLGEQVYRKAAPHVREALKGKPVSYEIQIPGPSGPIYRAVRIVPDLGPDGRLHGMFALITDVTEQRIAEQELTRSSKLAALGTLVAGMAHELNQPLAAIQVLCKLITDEQELPVRAVTHDIETILDQTRRMAKIVDSVVALTPRTDEIRSSVPEQILDGVCDLMSERLRSAGIRIERQVEPDLPLIRADRHQLEQVLDNLITNAVHSLESLPEQDARKLLLGLRAKPETVEFLVEDSGPGVALEIQDRLFDPFFSTKAVGKGIGLGLSICQQIVAGHGGEIVFEPVETGGARFIVRLPRWREDDDGDSETIIDEPRLIKGKRILVVDNEEVLRGLVLRLLSANGHQATGVGSGESALAFLGQGDADIALLDFRMTGLSGIDLIERIQADHPAVKIVSMSGHHSRDDLARLEQLGVEAVGKPIEGDVLLEVIARLGSDLT